MKHAKKFASLLLALVMAFALATTAFAEGEPGSITINDAVVDQTYSVYQILDLESYNASAKAYTYKATTAWSDFINSSAIQGVYVDVDAQGYVTWHKTLTCESTEEGHTHTDACYTVADAAAFAKAAQKYAKDNSITNQGSVTATTATVSFTGLDLGYYLVDTTLGTLCSLNTTKPAVVMEEKNEVPTNVKTVEEDSTGNYGAKNDADIGQTVNFKSTITAQPGAENYIFHDEMSAGLTLDTNSIKVYVVNGETETELAAENNYTIKTTGTCKTDCDFEVHFTKAYLDTIKSSTTIVIKYSATLNENAVVGVEGNPNKSYLDYGTNPSDESKPGSQTPPSETKTYTWDVNVFKYAKDGETEKALAGATFTLSKSTDGSSPIALVSKGNNVYRVAKTGETGTVTEITTDDTGKFTIQGLDADTYYLTETTAPAGYNKLSGPTTVVIGENGAVSVDSVTVSEVKILNQSGTELPSTGGMGTTLFYVLGSVLVLGAVVLLVTKKRMSKG